MNEIMPLDTGEILDFIPDAALFINEEINEVLVNEEAQKLLGIKTTGTIDISCVFSQHSISEIKEITRELPVGKIDVTINHNDFNFPAVLNYKKKGTGFIATLHPHLFDARDNLNIISEISNDHIVVFMENDEFVYISDSVEKISGYSRHEIRNLATLDLIHPDDLSRVLTRKQIAHQQQSERYNQIFRVKHKNGHYIWLEAKVSRKYSHNFQTHKSIAFVKDITKRIKYEQALIEAKQTAEEAVKSKNQFLSEVSHDIRTPMNTIIGITHLLLNKKPRKEQVDLINTIKVSGDNLLSLINDILDFSKIQANKIEFESVDFDLLLLLKSLKIGFKIPAEAKGLAFDVSTEGQLPEHLKGDPYRLNQILNNLLSNAIKFTNKGKVSLKVGAEEIKNGYNLTFSVSDTGIGISEDKKEQIFEPYKQADKDTTRKYGGTGLGLTILKKLVELQGGHISVVSEVNKGSTFKVVIPFAKSESKKKTEVIEQADLSEVSVLYVEDVVSNQLLMKGLCAMWGMNIDVASTGQRALELLEDNTYDLLLIDLHLPDYNGEDLVKKIRSFASEYFKNIPIIAVTGKTSKGLAEKLKLTGFNDLATKPLNPENLQEKISAQIGSRTDGMENDEIFTDVNFGTLDQIYRNKTEDYIDLLNLLKMEYQKYFEALEYSIENGDLKGVRSITHKMTPNLKTLKMMDFISFLDNIKHEMRSNPGNFSHTRIINQLKPVFENIILMIDQKIESLTTTAE